MLLTVSELQACDLCHACGAPALGEWFTPAQVRTFNSEPLGPSWCRLRVVGDPRGIAYRHCASCECSYCSDHWLFQIDLMYGVSLGIDGICPWGHRAYNIAACVWNTVEEADDESD
jgi:hypothetical protein